jgi:hypothetical protein
MDYVPLLEYSAKVVFRLDESVETPPLDFPHLAS